MCKVCRDDMGANSRIESSLLCVCDLCILLPYPVCRVDLLL